MIYVQCLVLMQEVVHSLSSKVESKRVDAGMVDSST